MIKEIKNILIFITSITIIGCAKDEIEQPAYLLYEFDPMYIAYLMPNYSIYNNYGSGYEIQYSNNKISKVIQRSAIGVPMPINGDISQAQPIDTYDEILYIGNKVELKRIIDKDVPNKVLGTVEFTLDSKNRIIKWTNRRDTTDYYYSGNGLLQESVTRNGGYCKITSQYYFNSDKNLTCIKGRIENKSGYNLVFNQYFRNYDSAPNSFSRLGIVSGCFLRSVSRNNFSTYSSSMYTINGELTDSMEIKHQLKYDEKGYAIFVKKKL